MARETNHSRRNLLVALLSLLFVPLIGTAFGSEAYSPATLGFFRVVDDKATYDQQPQKFEVLVFQSTAGSYERYVERSPSLRIASVDVKSIAVEKAKVYGGEKGVDEVVRDTLSPKLEKKRDDRDFPLGYVYKATFSLTEKAGIIFNQFAKKHEQQPFDFRFGKDRLAVVQFMGPFEGSYEFTAFLEEKNPDRLKEIFASIKSKVIWK